MDKISIWSVFRIFRKHLILMLVVAVFGGLLGFSLTAFVVAPRYTASAVLYVGSDSEGNATVNDLTYSKYLVQTYIEILKSNSIAEQVSTALKSKYPELTVETIKRMFEASSVNNTEVFRIAITSADKTMAVDVCNQIAKIAPQELLRITKASSVEVIDYANEAYTTVFHPVMRNMGLCAVLAFLITFLVVFLAKVMDDKIYSREELAASFKLPVLGVIPYTVGAGAKRKKRGAGHASSPIEEERKRLLDDDTPFHVAEAYRMIRTNLTYLPIGDQCKKIVFSTAVFGEGKTVTCCNLSLSLAQNGAKVLLVDADMRRPHIGELFGLCEKFGLSEYIADICKELPIYQSAYRNLYVMPSGKWKHHAAELLSSSRFEAMLKACEDTFDYIIFDMPPLNVVTDAAIIAKHVDGYILVSFSGYSTRLGIKATLDSLDQVDAKIFGFVLCGADPKSAAYGGCFGKYGKYGYDDKNNDAAGIKK